jgi:hypothetical protein
LRLLVAGTALVVIAPLLTMPGSSAATSLTMTTSASHGLFPGYRTETRDYAMYRCADRKVTLRFNRSVVLDGRGGRTHALRMKSDEARLIVIRDGGKSSRHTLRCLPDSFPRLTVERMDDRLDGLLLMSPDRTLSGPSYFMIADTNGVPLWYRTSPNNLSARVKRLNASGDLEVLFQAWDESDEKRLDANLANRLAVIDLDGRDVRIVRPTDGNGAKPIGFHGFASRGPDNYLFISHRLQASYKLPLALETKTIQYPGESRTELEQCVGADLWVAVHGKIIQTDGSGRVNWSYEVPDNDPAKSNFEVRWVGFENGVKTCYYETHHTNWVAFDSTGSTVLISLRLRGIMAVDLATKRVLWTLEHTSHGPGGKAIEVVSDPLRGLSGAGQHSVSLDGNNRLLFFDNRSDPTEVGRAVLYQLDVARGTARHIRSFFPPRNACSTSAGKVFCYTENMGNATFTQQGYVIVDWGQKGNNPNVLTMFDTNGKVLLDVRDETGRTAEYKSEYISAKLNGKPLVSLQVVLNGTDNASVGSFRL